MGGTHHTNPPGGPWDKNREKCCVLRGADPTVFVSRPRVALSSLQVPSRPETGGRPPPAGCRLTGRSNHWDLPRRGARVPRAVQGRREVPSVRPDRLDRSQVCPPHL